MKSKTSLCFLLLSLFCSHLFAQQTASEYYDAAMKAYKEKDYESFVNNLHKVVEAGTNHPRVYYNLACGYALLNNTPETIQWLDRIGGLGIAYPIREDEDLKSIRETPEFKVILEKFEQNSRPKRGEFTLGMIVGDDFYFVANSQLSIYLEDHNAKLSPTIIRKLKL